MKISLIVAAATNDTIGKNNQLLWHLPNDLKFFKNTTWGMPVIMGRKTFESCNKALPGRINIVITRQHGWHAADIIIATDLADALTKAAETSAKEVFVIGGGEIYQQSIQMADRIYMTRVHASLEGDTFFPAIEPSSWSLISAEDFSADEKHLYPYTFQIWDRS